jgi:uncharacterized membrane protein
MIYNIFIGLCIFCAIAMPFWVAALLADLLAERLPRESVRTLRRAHSQASFVVSSTDLDRRTDGARRIP